MAPLHDELDCHRSSQHSLYPVCLQPIVCIILDAIDCALILLIDIICIAFTKFACQACAPMHTIVLGVEHVFIFISISGSEDLVDVLYTFIFYSEFFCK